MVLTERQHTGEFILSEAPGTLSREKVTVTAPASTRLQPGHVLGLVATKYEEYDNSNPAAAAAILYNEVDNTATPAPTDFVATVIIRCAEVRKADLQWKSGLTDNDKTAAYTDLASTFVIARD